MNKAFIFDMDGVVVDSERAWVTYGNSFLPELFGEKIARKIGSTIGMSANQEYDKATKYGFRMDKQKYFKLYDRKAAYIYAKANITPNLDKLVKKLINLRFKLGLVTSSRRTWLNNVLPRLNFSKKINFILSINDRLDIKPKPNPDGYLEAIKNLGSIPAKTIILEDSNLGIKAAKAAGAYTIGFKQNLVAGYQQKGADIYAENIDDVINIVGLFPTK